MSTTNILDLNNRIDALEKNSGGGGTADSAKRSDIATEFNTTTAYTAGCYVYHEGKLYQFNTDHAAGDWDPTDVVEANVTDQIVSNKSAIDGLTASDIAYDNTDSGLTATDVQGAVDELRQADNIMLSDGVTSVEDVLTYSSTEHKVGKWIDGSDLYEKTIDFDALPNNTIKKVSSGVSNITIRKMEGIGIGTAANVGGAIYIPYYEASSYASLEYTPNNEIRIKSNFDVSLYNGYVTLRYTKNN